MDKPLLNFILAALLLPIFGGSAAALPAACHDGGAQAQITFDAVSRSIARQECVEVDSGGKVKWKNLDTMRHDPGDALDGGACFRTLTDTGATLGVGESFSVEFTWIASLSRIAVRAWDADNEPVLFPDPVTGTPVDVRLCTDAAHNVRSDGKIEVLYLSYTSWETVGGVVVIDP